MRPESNGGVGGPGIDGASGVQTIPDRGAAYTCPTPWRETLAQTPYTSVPRGAPVIRSRNPGDDENRTFPLVSPTWVRAANKTAAMKKRDLIQAVALHAGVDNKTAGKVVEGTIDVILANVAKGEIVNISGFAKFAKIKRPARIARNPATGEQVKVKAKTVAKITALKGFKDIALGVAPAPKLNTTPPKPAAPAKKVAAKKAAPKKAAAKKAAPKKAAPKKAAKKATKRR